MPYLHSAKSTYSVLPQFHLSEFERVKCLPIIPAYGRLYSLDWSGLDWSGLEWTGLTQKSVKMPFQCRTEAKHTYSVTKVACTACFRVFARVGRGQRSRAYLMSFSNELQSSRGYLFMFSMLQQKAGVRFLQ